MFGPGTGFDPDSLRQLSQQLKELNMPKLGSREESPESGHGGGDPAALPFRRPTDGSIRGLLRATRESRVVTPLSPDTNLYEYDLPIKNLPPALEGFTILHLSDIHFQQESNARLLNFIRLTNHLDVTRQKVDLVCLTGDIVTRSSEDLDSYAIANLRYLARNAHKVFVMGNHDYYDGKPEQVRAKMAEAGYQELSNSWATFQVDGSTIALYGTDDHLEGHPAPPHPDSYPASDFNIILTHNLDAVNRTFPDIFKLVFSGHLHGGEMGIGPINGVIAMKRRGHTRDNNRQRIGWDALSPNLLSYVSPGQARHLGNFGVRKPGATLIRLRKAPDGDEDFGG
jgi:predicted MPP superfamily phosphohydrolase